MLRTLFSHHRNPHELCEVMEVHPLTLLTLAYVGDRPAQGRSASGAGAPRAGGNLEEARRAVGARNGQGAGGGREAARGLPRDQVVRAVLIFDQATIDRCRERILVKGRGHPGKQPFELAPTLERPRGPLRDRQVTRRLRKKRPPINEPCAAQPYNVPAAPPSLS